MLCPLLLVSNFRSRKLCHPAEPARVSEPFRRRTEGLKDLKCFRQAQAHRSSWYVWSVLFAATIFSSSVVKSATLEPGIAK